MSVSNYYHLIPTWEVYPRVYYFQKRYKDIHRRFLNIINKGPYPFLFKKSDLLDDLEDLKRKLEIPLKICVIGRENLERGNLVITTEPFQRIKKEESLSSIEEGPKATNEEGITIFVAYASISDVGRIGLKEVEDTVSHVLPIFGKTSPVPIDKLLIVCHMSIEYPQTEVENFRSSILDNLKESFGLDITADRVVLGAGGEMISTNISQMMESTILQGFFVMREHLQGFVCNKGRLNKGKVDVLETEQVMNAIQGFLKNGLGLVDILEDSKSENLPFLDILLRHLARIIRCAILDPLSVEVNLPQDICNNMAFEMEFDDHVKESVSKNTQYHLSKLQQPSEDLIKATKEHNKSYRFPGRNFIFIAYPLKEDVRKVVIQLEEALATLQRTTTVMKKMIFELDGDIKQSIIKAHDTQEEKKKRTIPKEMRKEILTIDGVYGVGTLYDKFEIHVETSEVEINVLEILHRNKLDNIVRVRKIIKSPKQLVGRHVEHGTLIESQLPGEEGRFRSGTLGLFVDSNNDELHALTCAHVVNHGRNVYIHNGNGERELFATSHPNMTICMGDPRHPLVDIAAVKVENNLYPDCTKFLKDDDGMLKCAELSTETPGALSERYIYKYGAASGLTRGLVCSSDYTLTDGEDDEYLILLTCPPGSDDMEVYAKPGDSGSINCMPNVESNKTVKVVSMLSHGDLVLEGIDDSIFISFHLMIGLQKFSARGINLNVPNMYGNVANQAMMY